MGDEKVGPRMGVKLDGKLLFFDHNGEPLPVKKMKKEDFARLIENNESRSKQEITIYTFGPSSNCRIVFHTKYGDICFWVDCNTNQVLGLC